MFSTQAQQFLQSQQNKWGTKDRETRVSDVKHPRVHMCMLVHTQITTGAHFFVYTFVCSCTHTNNHRGTFIRLYIHKHLQRLPCPHTHKYVHTHVYSHTHTHTYAHTQPHTLVHTHTHTHSRIHWCTHTHTHVHTHAG